MKGAPSWSFHRPVDHGDLPPDTFSDFKTPPIRFESLQRILLVPDRTLETKEATTGITEGPWSTEVTETTTVSTLGQVTGLTVGSPNTSELSVDWIDVPNVDSYIVQWRRGTNGDFSFVKSVPSEAVISDLWAGRTYEVRVRAKKTGYGDGAWSTIVSATVGSLAQVSGIGVANPEYNRLVLTWNAVDGASHYTVKWGTTTGTYTESNSLEITTNTYTIHRLNREFGCIYPNPRHAYFGSFGCMEWRNI